MNVSEDNTKELESYGVWVKNTSKENSNSSDKNNKSDTNNVDADLQNNSDNLDFPDFDSADFSDMFKDDTQFSTTESQEDDFTSGLDSTLSSDELSNITDFADVSMQESTDNLEEEPLPEISASEEISDSEPSFTEETVNNEEITTEESSDEINFDDNEEISLDDFMDGGFSDESVAAGNNGYEPGKETSAPIKQKDSSETEELSLDDFMDGDFETAPSEVQPQKEDIADEPPLEMDISFDDSAENVETEENISVETYDDFDEDSVAVESEEISLDDFGDVFDEPTPEKPVEDTQTSFDTSKTEDVNMEDSEEIDLSDFGIDANAEETPINQDVEEAKKKDTVVDYDLFVGDENTSSAPIVNEIKSTEKSEIADEPEKEQKNTTSVDISILQQIMAELTNLKNDINTLKSNIEEIKTEEANSKINAQKTEQDIQIPQTETKDEGGFFSDADDDDTIALSCDELNNIMNTAEFSENQENTPAQEPKEIPLTQNEQKTESEENSAAKEEFVSDIEENVSTTIEETVSTDVEETIPPEDDSLSDSENSAADDLTFDKNVESVATAAEKEFAAKEEFISEIEEEFAEKEDFVSEKEETIPSDIEENVSTDVEETIPPEDDSLYDSENSAADDLTFDENVESVATAAEEEFAEKEDFVSETEETIPNDIEENVSTTIEETVSTDVEETIPPEDDSLSDSENSAADDLTFDENVEISNDLSFDFEDETLEEPAMEDISVSDENFEDALPEEISIPKEENIFVESNSQDFMDSIEDSNNTSKDESTQDLIQEENFETENADDDIPTVEKILENQEPEPPFEEELKEDSQLEDDFIDLANSEILDEEPIIEETSVDFETEVLETKEDNNNLDSAENFDELDANETSKENAENQSAFENQEEPVFDTFENSDNAETDKNETVSEDIVFEEAQATPYESSETTSKEEQEKNITAKKTLNSDLMQDVKSLLLYMDQLLEDLPEEKIEEFANSDKFVLFKNVFEKLGLN